MRNWEGARKKKTDLEEGPLQCISGFALLTGFLNVNRNFSIFNAQWTYLYHQKHTQTGLQCSLSYFTLFQSSWHLVVFKCLENTNLASVKWENFDALAFRSEPDWRTLNRPFDKLWHWRRGTCINFDLFSIFWIRNEMTMIKLATCSSQINLTHLNTKNQVKRMFSTSSTWNFGSRPIVRVPIGSSRPKHKKFQKHEIPL